MTYVVRCLNAMRLLFISHRLRTCSGTDILHNGTWYAGQRGTMNLTIVLQVNIDTNEVIRQLLNLRYIVYADSPFVTIWRAMFQANYLTLK